MKVGLIRGAYLSQFEMQTYEKLLPYIDLEAYEIRCNRFDSSLIKVPVKKLRTIGGPLSIVNAWLGFYFNLFLQASCGLDYWHFGLLQSLADKDIAHTMETFNAFSYQALKAKRKFGTKLVVTVWENRPFAAERFSAKRRMKYEVIRNADLFLAMTPRAADCLLLEGASEDKIKVQPMGVDISRFAPRPKPREVLDSLGFNEQDFVFLSVAALRWEKGVFDVLYAFYSLLRETQRKDIKLFLAGGGPAAAELHKRSIRLGIQKQVIIKKFPYEKMHEAYNLADVFILASVPRPGWQEQFGYVLPEALASGLPVISTLSGSIPEVTGNDAILVPSADFRALAENMRKTLIDTEYRERLAKKARWRAERFFDSRQNAMQIRKAYERIV